MSKDWIDLISQPKYGIRAERDVFVPMRDGVRLAVNIYRPDTRGKFPALLAMGGYGKELQELLRRHNRCSRAPSGTEPLKPVTPQKLSHEDMLILLLMLEESASQEVNTPECGPLRRARMVLTS